MTGQPLIIAPLGKYGVAFAATDESLGRVDITSAKYHRILREAEARKIAMQPVYGAVLAELAAITDPVSRAVLDLHRIEQGSYSFLSPVCMACDDPESEHTEFWPCVTVHLVAGMNGVSVPSDWSNYDFDEVPA